MSPPLPTPARPAPRASSLLLLCVCLGSSVGCLELEATPAPIPEAEVTVLPKIMLNKIMLNKIMLNALTGVWQNVQLLTSKPMVSSTFDHKLPGGELGFALVDPDALELMPYLISCALAPEDKPVQWTDPWNGTGHHVWSGQAGLCREWVEGAPSEQCLQLVSACLLARENALGISVATSQRGQHLDGSAFATDKYLQAKASGEDGELLPSFERCTTKSRGAARDCGWSAANSWVGSCSPGQNVKLSCSKGQDSVVRICDGVGACDRYQQIASATGICSSAPSLSFSCPASGTYAAMAGPGYANPSRDYQLQLTTKQGWFPTSELRAFFVREASFFGSIFAGPISSSIDVSIDSSGPIPLVSKQVVPLSNPSTPPVDAFSDAYVCADLGWTDADAYLHDRLCAVLTDDDGDQLTACVAQRLGRCNSSTFDSPVNRCAQVDGGPKLGDGDFDDCQDDTGQSWTHGITVFLNGACDLIRPGLHGGSCARR